MFVEDKQGYISYNELQRMSSQDISKYIEHHGVAGMKWGVRRTRRLQALQRAGTKGGPKISKVRALANVGPVDLIKGRGITGGAHRKAVRIKGQLGRHKAGKATTVDLVKRYGSTRVSDLIPTTKSRQHLQTTAKRDAVIVAGAGALFAARLIAKRAARS